MFAPRREWKPGDVIVLHRDQGLAWVRLVFQVLQSMVKYALNESKFCIVMEGFYSEQNAQNMNHGCEVRAVND